MSVRCKAECKSQLGFASRGLSRIVRHGRCQNRGLVKLPATNQGPNRLERRDYAGSGMEPKYSVEHTDTKGEVKIPK